VPTTPADDPQHIIADLRRQLAECKADRDEALEYQTATSDVLKVIARPTSDLQTVLRSLIHTAARICSADTGTIWIREADAYRAAASTQMALEPELWALRRQQLMVPSRASIAARVALEGRVVHVADRAADPDYAWPESTASGRRTGLGVPLLRDSDPIGILVLSRKRVEPFTERQIDLVRTFANQAVIAMENARLITETREALEQQTATVEVLGVINSSPGELAPVFAAMLDKALRLCTASGGLLRSYDGQFFGVLAARGLAPEALAPYHERVRVSAESAIGRMEQTKRVVHVHDIAAVDYRRDEDTVWTRSVAAGVRTLLLVPLLRENTLVGAFTVFRTDVRPFTDKQIELVRTFADQAVIAMENARLLGELQARTRDLTESLEYQTATSDVLNVISRSTADVQPVLDTVAETAARLCVADSGTIYIREGEVYRAASASFMATEPELWAATRHRTIVPGRQNIAARAALEGRVVHVEDILADSDYTYPEGLRPGRRTYLGVPFLRDGELIGVIALSRKRVEPFTERQIELVRTFADQAVIAIENARLFGELQARTAELADRNTAFAERIEHQSATIDVLKEMSASPADAQPVFDLICDQARALIAVPVVSLFEYDGTLAHLRTASRDVSFGSAAARAAYDAGWPRVPDPGSLSCRAILDGTIIHIRDMDAEPGVSPEVRALAFKSQVAIPLMRDGRAIGAISTSSLRVDGISDTQIELLKTFGEQAVIAIQSAETWRELQARTRDLEESLEYQTATSDVLNVISRSTFDLQPVLDTVVDTAARLCTADGATIAIREGDAYRPASSSFSAAEPEYWATLRQRAIVPGSHSVAGRAALEGRVVQIADIQADPDFALPEVVAAGRRTMLGAPLLREGAVLGTINLYRNRVEPFTERQIELIRTFADQAVIAMENARLLGELQARTRDLEESLEYQTATSDVLNVISRSTADVQPVLDTVVETATQLCKADSGSIWIRDGEVYRNLAFSAAYQAEPEYWVTNRHRTIVPGPNSLAGRAALEGRVVHIEDIRADPASVLPEAVASGRRTMLGVPLLRDGEPIGVITMSRKRVEPFTERQIELVRTFADQAVIAIENARLLDEIRQRQAELRVTFDNMGDAVVMFDENLHLAAWNKNFQELLDLSDEFFAEPHDFETYIRYLTARGEFGADADPEAEMARLRPRFGDHYSFERERPDGRVIEVRHNPMPDGGFVLIYSDITERKRSEEEIRAARDAAEAAYRDLQAAQASLVQAQKMAALGQLTAGIAHEIKNPLNFVNNFASLSTELLGELREEVEPALAPLDTNQREGIDETIDLLTGNLDRIVEHGQRADNIVKSMLEHSRGGSGERREVDLNALVDEALNLAYHGARAQDAAFNIALERDYGPSLGPVELAPQEMTRVFLNLIGNGFYATTKRVQAKGDETYQPCLSVSTREASGGVEVRVRDNGTGISADIRDKLFQPFFTTKPTGEGTGLGLSISYDIVTQQHGGTIEVESEEGAFTAFTIRLPRP
jgi:GAF domain-containing protein